LASAYPFYFSNPAPQFELGSGANSAETTKVNTAVTVSTRRGGTNTAVTVSTRRGGTNTAVTVKQTHLFILTQGS